MLVFLEEADGTLRKFSLARFCRLHSQHKTESLPEHAGQWLRFAKITLGMKAHEPPIVIQAHYSRYKVQKNGRFDPKCLFEHLRLGMTQFEIWTGGFRDEEVLDAGPHVERKKLAERLLWVPTAAQVRSVRQRALGEIALAWKKALEPSRSTRLRNRLKAGHPRQARDGRR